MENQPTNQAPEQPVVQAVIPDTQPHRHHTLAMIFGPLSLCIALLIIGGMLLAWKPWHSAGKAGDRTITVTGTSQITSEPDEYVFNPQYEFKNVDKTAALKNITDKTNDIVAQLKKLGVADSKIKTDTSGYGGYYSNEGNTYYAYLTVTVDNKTQAQKVQDYLLTTEPYGSVSPQANFSKAKQKTLESQGRNQATKDARAKADQSAQNLGFKVGDVKTVSDEPSGGSTRLYATSIANGAASATADTATTAPIQAGENDQSYSVTVTYYVK